MCEECLAGEIAGAFATLPEGTPATIVAVGEHDSLFTYGESSAYIAVGVGKRDRLGFAFLLADVDSRAVVADPRKAELIAQEARSSFAKYNHRAIGPDGLAMLTRFLRDR